MEKRRETDGSTNGGEKHGRRSTSHDERHHTNARRRGQSEGARDRAIAELAEALGLDRATAGGIVDLLVLAAVHETGARIAESLLEPIAVAASQGADAVKEIQRSAHAALGGQQ
jgi:hypothetical protein